LWHTSQKSLTRNSAVTRQFDGGRVISAPNTRREIKWNYRNAKTALQR
jgi:hypothetical protein